MVGHVDTAGSTERSQSLEDSFTGTGMSSEAQALSNCCECDKTQDTGVTDGPHVPLRPFPSTDHCQISNLTEDKFENATIKNCWILHFEVRPSSNSFIIILCRALGIQRIDVEDTDMYNHNAPCLPTLQSSSWTHKIYCFRQAPVVLTRGDLYKGRDRRRFQKLKKQHQLLLGQEVG